MNYGKILLASIFLLAGCDSLDVEDESRYIRVYLPTDEEPEPRPTRIPAATEIIVAAQFINFDERTNRQELKEFLGVDPRRTEWCAAFINAVLNESGIPGSDTVSEYPLTARSFLKWGNKVPEPMPGDIVIFPRGNEPWQGHVGFYISTVYVKGVEYYQILGGNQNNKVTIELYRANRALGVRRYSSV